MALSPKQFESVHESHDFNTGYRTVTHDISVPEFGEHGSHEPSAIRAQAQEYGRNKWQMRVTLGPHLERDATGSYYKGVYEEAMEGAPGAVKQRARQLARLHWGKVIGARQA